MRRNWILASSLGLASTMLLTTAHASADIAQNNGGEPQNANENTLDASQQVTSQDVYNDKQENNIKALYEDNKLVEQGAKNSISSDINLDVSNHWKQPQDMSTALSSDGTTKWLSNGDQYSTAKVVNLDLNYGTNQTKFASVDYLWLKFSGTFRINADDLRSGKTIHLFRLAQVSDTGYLPHLLSDAYPTVYWKGKKLGDIRLEDHFSYFDSSGENPAMIDYADVVLFPSDLFTNLVGDQEISISTGHLATLNYNSPFVWRGAPSVSNVSLIATNDAYKKELKSVWAKSNFSFSPRAKENVSGFGSRSLELDGTAEFGTHGDYGVYSSSYLGVPLSEQQLKAFSDSGFKQLSVSKFVPYQEGFILQTTNGNRLLPRINVGDTVGLRVAHIIMPIVDDQGRVTASDFGFDDGYDFSDQKYRIKRFADDLSLQDLRAKNYVGVAASFQENGSLFYYVNLPGDFGKQIDSFKNRYTLMKKLLLYSSYINRSSVVNDINKLKSLLSNTVDYYFAGPLKGLLWHAAMIDYGTVFKVADQSESTTINAMGYSGGNLDSKVASTFFTYTADQASLSGQSAITLHYIDGQNGGQIGKIQTTIGDPGKPANVSINVPTGYHVRQQNDGKSIILGKGKTFDLPSGAGMYNVGQMLDFGPSNSTIDYYVVLDHNELMNTITFVDQDGKQVGDPVMVKGLSYSDQDVQLAIPDGYLAYAGQGVPLRLHFSDHNENHQVLLKHQLVLITSDHGVEAGSLIPNTKACHFAKGLTTGDLNKTVTRTIKAMDAGGWEDDIVTQTAHFYRNALYDVVTGEVTYLPWSFGGQYMLPIYLPEAKPGYQIDNVKETTVTPDSQDIILSVAYQELPSQITVKYMDHTGKVIKTAHPKINNNQVVFDADVPAGYQLATNVNSVKKLDRLSQEYDVLVAPIQRAVMPYERDSAVTEPLAKLVTRTIKITLTNGHQRVIRQQVRFERRAVIDNTGKVTYTDWQAIGSDRFNKLNVPKRKGYKLVITGSGLDRVDHVEASDGNQVVTVKYVRI